MGPLCHALVGTWGNRNLQRPEGRFPKGQIEELRSCFCHWREVRWSARLPHRGGHVRHGGGEQNRPQDDLLLRAGGLQDVQRALVGKTFSHSSFQGAKSRLLSADCFLGKPYMRFDRSIRS